MFISEYLLPLARHGILYIAGVYVHSRVSPLSRQFGYQTGHKPALDTTVPWAAPELRPHPLTIVQRCSFTYSLGKSQCKWTPSSLRDANRKNQCPEMVSRTHASHRELHMLSVSYLSLECPDRCPSGHELQHNAVPGNILPEFPASLLVGRRHGDGRSQGLRVGYFPFLPMPSPKWMLAAVRYGAYKYRAV